MTVSDMQVNLKYNPLWYDRRENRKMNCRIAYFYRKEWREIKQEGLKNAVF